MFVLFLSLSISPLPVSTGDAFSEFIRITEQRRDQLWPSPGKPNNDRQHPHSPCDLLLLLNRKADSDFIGLLWIKGRTCIVHQMIPYWNTVNAQRFLSSDGVRVHMIVK